MHVGLLVLIDLVHSQWRIKTGARVAGDIATFTRCIKTLNESRCRHCTAMSCALRSRPHCTLPTLPSSALRHFGQKPGLQ